jgi:LAS superfamily LD-carboxypeptidase LdcB
MNHELLTRNELIITERDRITTDAIFSALEEAAETGRIVKNVERGPLYELLADTHQINLIDRVYSTDPSIYGFRGPYCEIEPAPESLILIEPRAFYVDGEKRMTREQYMPPHTFESYRAMATAMEEELGRPLLVASAYRTSVRQALTFLSILRSNKYDVDATAKRVAIPGYSEHGTPSQLALDFQNIDGSPSDEDPRDFERTEEYEWLLRNAKHFDFYLSYPENNPEGVMFEPWHWRHQPLRAEEEAKKPTRHNIASKP